MPRIIIQADAAGVVTFSERVAASHLESDHYTAQLLERLAWAASDAEIIEARTASPGDGELWPSPYRLAGP